MYGQKKWNSTCKTHKVFKNCIIQCYEKVGYKCYDLNLLCKASKLLRFEDSNII